MPVSEICFMTATEIAQRIRSRELSCREVVAAHLAQIEQVNPRVNAIVTRIPDEQVLARAQSADEALARGDKLGLLHGLPIAHKDFVPDHDGLIVVDAFLILLQATAILVPDPLLKGPDRVCKLDR